MKVRLGDAVTYVDEHGREFAALVTAIWGQIAPSDVDSTRLVTASTEPCAVNLVFISASEARRDGHGRQIERGRAVVHESRQVVGAGHYWK